MTPLVVDDDDLSKTLFSRKREEQEERKREEEKMRKQRILEEYKMKKAQEEEEKTGGSHGLMSIKSHAGSLAMRQKSARPISAPNGPKSRPKSLHVNSSFMADFSSLDPKVSKVTSAHDTTDNVGIKHPMTPSGGKTYGRKNSLDHLNNQSLISGFGSTGASRPQSAMSQSTHHLSSPPSTSTGLGLPTMPSLFRHHKGPPSDGSLDVSSLCSDYNGPKLFVKPCQKSNRGIILNAINVVLAGVVNADTKTKVLEVSIDISDCHQVAVCLQTLIVNICQQELGKTDGKQFLILFRGAGLQFRGIYCFYHEHEMAVKLYGTGPKNIVNEMIDKFFK